MVEFLLQQLLRTIPVEFSKSFIGPFIGAARVGQHIKAQSPVKIISWNVIGVGREGFCSQVRFLISKYTPACKYT